MEENEIILLKNSRMYVTRVGRWLNLFSFLALIGSLLVVAGGILMLYVSNMLDEATPYYLDNIIGLGGVGMIVLAAAIIPLVVYARRCVRLANQVRVSQEIYPVVDFLRVQQKLWRYVSIVLIVLLVVTIVGAIVGTIYYRSLSIL